MKIREAIEAILDEEFGVDPLKDGDPDDLVDDLHLDSLDITYLMVLCDKIFCIQIDEYDREGINTLTDLVKFIEDHK